MKLRFKFLIMCLACTLMALILQTLLFQKASSDIIYKWAKEGNGSSLQNMQNEIYSFLKNMESNLIEIYNEKDLIEAFRGKGSVKELKKEFYHKAYEIGTTDFNTSDGVVALYLYTPEHEIVSAYRRAMTPKHNYPADLYYDTNYSNSDMIRNYIESEQVGMLVSSYYNEYRETNILHLALKLYDSHNYRQVIGYVVCDVDSKVICSIMEKYSTDKSMYIWLQPSGDRTAASIGILSSKEEKEYKEIFCQIKEGNIKESEISSSASQEFFIAVQKEYGLTAYSLMPRELLRENQKVLTANLFLIAGIMIVVTAVLMSVVSLNLTKPLYNLMNTMEQIKNGNTSLRASIKNKDEIGMLGKNFNEMLDKMEELTEKEKKTTYLLGQAKYNALQAQINPHFLYNTLDTMSSIAQIRECPEVEWLSQALSSIFRYSLNMKDSFSTISKEITHLKNYCYVMDVRMRNNVKYSYHIEEETIQKEIPRLSLQPLVENALNHGLQNKRGDKCIEVCAKKEGENLVIYIADNGIGMDADKFNDNLKKSDIQYVEQGRSIGLYNINARLKMLYGSQYGLWIESIINKGTKVYMKIPWERKEEKEV